MKFLLEDPDNVFVSDLGGTLPWQNGHSISVFPAFVIVGPTLREMLEEDPSLRGDERKGGTHAGIWKGMVDNLLFFDGGDRDWMKLMLLREKPNSTIWDSTVANGRFWINPRNGGGYCSMWNTLEEVKPVMKRITSALKKHGILTKELLVEWEFEDYENSLVSTKDILSGELPDNYYDPEDPANNFKYLRRRQARTPKPPKPVDLSQLSGLERAIRAAGMDPNADPIDHVLPPGDPRKKKREMVPPTDRHLGGFTTPVERNYRARIGDSLTESPDLVKLSDEEALKLTDPSARGFSALSHDSIIIDLARGQGHGELIERIKSYLAGGEPTFLVIGPVTDEILKKYTESPATFLGGSGRFWAESIGEYPGLVSCWYDRAKVTPYIGVITEGLRQLDLDARECLWEFRGAKPAPYGSWAEEEAKKIAADKRAMELHTMNPVEKFKNKADRYVPDPGSAAGYQTMAQRNFANRSGD